MSPEESPELSVVVPVYNEAGNVARLLRELSRQRDILMEVIVSDGASTDGSIDGLSAIRGEFPFPIGLLSGPKGRGRQLNLGARAARAAVILFLHADSRFPDPLALRKGVDTLRAAIRSGTRRVAGRFSLQFDFPATPPLPYRYYAKKATLDRPGCTHGDQGFMLAASFFREIGPFDEELPLMEDTLLAERIRGNGEWLLLPAQIVTSPRRFVTEGLLPRQTLNAILMNLAAIGRWDLIESLREGYRSQDTATRLRLAPFLSVLKEGIAALPEGERGEFWYRTGSYVRGNAWQIPFFLDVLVGRSCHGRGGSFLGLHDRLFGRLIDNRAGNWGAAALVWLWFRLSARR